VSSVFSVPSVVAFSSNATGMGTCPCHPTANSRYRGSCQSCSMRSGNGGFSTLSSFAIALS
jgi:hypothetical protein